MPPSVIEKTPLTELVSQEQMESSTAACLSPGWLQHLVILVARYPGFGFDADLRSMAFPELQGLYAYLLRQQGSSNGLL